MVTKLIVVMLCQARGPCQVTLLVVFNITRRVGGGVGGGYKVLHKLKMIQSSEETDASRCLQEEQILEALKDEM